MEKYRKILIKIILFAASVLLLSSNCLGNGQDEEPYQCGDYKYTIYNGEARIVKYLGNDSEVIVPDTLDGYPVTKIGRGVFSMNQTVEYIYLPEGITTIEPLSINECYNLKSVFLPNSLIEIGWAAFSFSGLENIKIPENTTSIGWEAFLKCWNLKEITILAKDIDIKKEAFLDTSLTQVDLPVSLSGQTKYYFNSFPEDCKITRVPQDFWSKKFFELYNSKVGKIIIDTMVFFWESGVWGHIIITWCGIWGFLLIRGIYRKLGLSRSYNMHENSIKCEKFIFSQTKEKEIFRYCYPEFRFEWLKKMIQFLLFFLCSTVLFAYMYFSYSGIALTIESILLTLCAAILKIMVSIVVIIIVYILFLIIRFGFKVPLKSSMRIHKIKRKQK